MATKEGLEAEWLHSKISTELLKSDKLVKNYCDNARESFKISDIQIKFIGFEEAFMMTICYRAFVVYEFAGVTGTCALVVKKTPKLPEQVFKSMCFAELFSNEIEAYNVIIPAIEQFIQQPLNVPKFHFGELKQNSAAVILEDFGTRDYRIASDMYNLSLEHILLAVKYLANFHAVGFAMKHTDRKHFDKLSSGISEARYASDELPMDWEVQQLNSVYRIVRATREYQASVPETFLSKLQGMLKDSYKYAKQIIKPVEPMVTLCHGDYLRNNIAFKYAQHCETPLDVMMFDLQTVRVSSPMMDLTILLALSAFAEVRAKNFASIFQTYCKELARVFVAHTKATLPAYLSEPALLKEYVRFSPYGLSTAAYFLMSLVQPLDMKPEEALTLQQTPEEIVQDVLERGGATVDRELAHQVLELYEGSLQHDVDIF